jgi:hypothetical protein
MCVVCLAQTDKTHVKAISRHVGNILPHGVQARPVTMKGRIIMATSEAEIASSTTEETPEVALAKADKNVGGTAFEARKKLQTKWWHDTQMEDHKGVAQDKSRRRRPTSVCTLVQRQEPIRNSWGAASSELTLSG